MLGPVVALKTGEPSATHPAVAEIARFIDVLAPGTIAAQAAALAERLDGSEIAGVHGYFAHAPASVAAAAAKLRGLPYGFSAHALDVRKTPRSELARLARQASVVVSCNRETAAEVALAAGTQPVLVPHGVDLAAFTPSAPPAAATVELLAVGRMVEKKGFAVLLSALAELDHAFRLRLVGDGPLREQLTAQVQASGLSGPVQLVGRQTHATLPAMYAAADVVIVPSVVDRNGDRDGLPNVVLEAMASGRPVVASDVAAISDAVSDGVTGTLVPPGDAGALAAALAKQIADPGLRAAMGTAGRQAVERNFDLGRCTARLLTMLERAYG
ncbi:MAG: glycosyltransferase [Actinomycetota bacterium]|nr:glycosyltransferase [Actinomycetota bacterium]